MSYQLKCKRGNAYRCMHCQHPESFIAEKNRVEAHILKRHLALDKTRFYCTLCMFRCNDKNNLDRHLWSFVPHIRQKETQMNSNRYLRDMAYLKESPAPHLFNTTMMDYVSLPHAESARFWSTKSRSETVTPLVSLPYLHASTPASLPHSSYHHLSTVSSNPTATPTSHLSSLTMPSYPTATATSHLSLPTIPSYPTATATSFLPLPTMPSYPTATATIHPPLPTMPLTPTAGPNFQLPTMSTSTTAINYYTAEPINHRQTMPSSSSITNQTIAITAELSSYLPIEMSGSPNMHTDFEVFSQEVGSPTRKVLEREAVATSKDEQIGYILPQLLGHDQLSNNLDKCQSPDLPTDINKSDDDVNRQVLQALTNFTKTQQVILQELGHLNKAVTTLSSAISLLRGQFRQQERNINRQQRVLDRLNATVNSLPNRTPRNNSRTTPYNRNTQKVRN
ncbi:unnamed protein product [Mytilus coruscus]|uniref:Uncharacterized protein n=1 Tax=Mytilus coruscus TaxID=42192 RepID=A0A6J8B194_MYTCO|nr:unnamed protein product [Mytilus coruscus]